jgi:putative DNA primase/helicase
MTPEWIPEPIVSAQTSDPGLMGYLHNDHGNAERLIAFRGEVLRYCPPMNSWLRYDGCCWRRDVTDRGRQDFKETMLAFLAEAIRSGSEVAQKFARASLDSKRITNGLREAQHRLAVLPDELDKDLYALNFSNGTVDLRNGQLRPHRREDLITRMVNYSFDSGARCPRFCKFLEEVTGGGPDAGQGDVERSGDLIDYLQKALGYSLTGVTSEKAVFLLHGPKDNGKSTLLATFLKLLGPGYAIVLQIDSLMVKPGGVDSNNAQADLADLRGARFVMTSETEEGQRLAEGKLKRITQGIGRIKATRKYENPIEFDENHKLWIDANHLPVIRSYDDATWRRLHTVPFTVIIPKDRQDRGLAEKLLAEGEGILAWAVKGAVRWYAEGLTRPEVVEQSSGAWRRDMDRCSAFLDECCQRGAGQVRARTLYDGYKKWAEGNGERPMSGRAFAERLRESGIEKRTDRTGTVYVSICLNAPLLDQEST